MKKEREDDEHMHDHYERLGRWEMDEQNCLWASAAMGYYAKTGLKGGVHMSICED